MGFWEMIQKNADNQARTDAMRQQQGLGMAQLAAQNQEGIRGNQLGLMGLQAQSEAGLRQHQLGLSGLDLQRQSQMQQAQQFGMSHGLQRSELDMKQQVLPYQLAELQRQQDQALASRGISRIFGETLSDSFANELPINNPIRKMLDEISKIDTSAIPPDVFSALMQTMIEMSTLAAGRKEGQ